MIAVPTGIPECFAPCCMRRPGERGGLPRTAARCRCRWHSSNPGPGEELKGRFGPVAGGGGWGCSFWSCQWTGWMNGWLGEGEATLIALIRAGRGMLISIYSIS